ncbi:MAG TPA: hydrolase 2, exosortase A system-associated [Janthinobacterium sp.]|nr:hydrolase 2, exosortase A system-associated [Janthinobacterium sp.]
MSPPSIAALPFFLGASPGERFCVFYPPAPGRRPRGAIVYAHPFAEEMNKSRRMAALQARAFACAGYGVLQIDLYGCGDSAGDFADARWQIWKDDLALACAWLTRRVDGPLSLWGLRLGALLALDVGADMALERMILWHPVWQGKSHLDQFLRLRLAKRMLADGGAGPSAREELAAGAIVEVGGYALAPRLAAAIDALDGTSLKTACPLHCFELAPGGIVGPAAARQAERRRAAGAELSLHGVPGLAFWASGEIVECQSLLAATAALCP